jgi:endonuclease G
LGDNLHVRLPTFKDKGEILLYTNFSVVMHLSRGLARFTAVNIDGESCRRSKRGGDVWSFDSRLLPEHQIGNEFYQRSGFDRGHLVRRLDPCWGADANQAVEDTFVFTNCAPQYPGFNQHLWLGLEDYLLENARVHGFKLNVFTGPIFDDNDPVQRKVQIPRAYWKVAVAVSAETKQLIAAGYVVSQYEMFPPFLEFNLGQFKTYQVPVSFIESKTGLDFGLKQFEGSYNNETTMAMRLLSSVDDFDLAFGDKNVKENKAMVKN